MIYVVAVPAVVLSSGSATISNHNTRTLGTLGTLAGPVGLLLPPFEAAYHQVGAGCMVDHPKHAALVQLLKDIAILNVGDDHHDASRDPTTLQQYSHQQGSGSTGSTYSSTKILLLGDTSTFFTLYKVISAAGLKPFQLDRTSGQNLLLESHGTAVCTHGKQDQAGDVGDETLQTLQQPYGCHNDMGMLIEQQHGVSVSAGLAKGSSGKMRGHYSGHPPCNELHLQGNNEVNAETMERLERLVLSALRHADVVMTTTKHMLLPGFPVASFQAVIHYMELELDEAAGIVDVLPTASDAAAINNRRTTTSNNKCGSQNGGQMDNSAFTAAADIMCHKQHLVSSSRPTGSASVAVQPQQYFLRTVFPSAKTLLLMIGLEGSSQWPTPPSHDAAGPATDPATDPAAAASDPNVAPSRRANHDVLNHDGAISQNMMNQQGPAADTYSDDPDNRNVVISPANNSTTLPLKMTLLLPNPAAVMMRCPLIVTSRSDSSIRRYRGIYESLLALEQSGIKMMGTELIHDETTPAVVVTMKRDHDDVSNASSSTAAAGKVGKVLNEGPGTENARLSVTFQDADIGSKTCLPPSLESMEVEVIERWMEIADVVMTPSSCLFVHCVDVISTATNVRSGAAGPDYCDTSLAGQKLPLRLGIRTSERQAVRQATSQSQPKLLSAGALPNKHQEEAKATEVAALVMRDLNKRLHVLALSFSEVFIVIEAASEMMATSLSRQAASCLYTQAAELGIRVTAFLSRSGAQTQVQVRNICCASIRSFWTTYIQSPETLPIMTHRDDDAAVVVTARRNLVISRLMQVLNSGSLGRPSAHEAFLSALKPLNPFSASCLLSTGLSIRHIFKYLTAGGTTSSGTSVLVVPQQDQIEQALSLISDTASLQHSGISNAVLGGGGEVGEDYLNKAQLMSHTSQLQVDSHSLMTQLQVQNHNLMLIVQRLIPERCLRLLHKQLLSRNVCVEEDDCDDDDGGRGGRGGGGGDYSSKQPHDIVRIVDPPYAQIHDEKLLAARIPTVHDDMPWTTRAAAALEVVEPQSTVTMQEAACWLPQNNNADNNVLLTSRPDISKEQIEQNPSCFASRRAADSTTYPQRAAAAYKENDSRETEWDHHLRPATDDEKSYSIATVHKPKSFLYEEDPLPEYDESSLLIQDCDYVGQHHAADVATAQTHDPFRADFSDISIDGPSSHRGSHLLTQQALSRSHASASNPAKCKRLKRNYFSTTITDREKNVDWLLTEEPEFGKHPCHKIKCNEDALFSQHAATGGPEQGLGSYCRELMPPDQLGDQQEPSAKRMRSHQHTNPSSLQDEDQLLMDFSMDDYHLLHNQHDSNHNATWIHSAMHPHDEACGTSKHSMAASYAPFHFTNHNAGPSSAMQVQSDDAFGLLDVNVDPEDYDAPTGSHGVIHLYGNLVPPARIPKDQQPAYQLTSVGRVAPQHYLASLHNHSLPAREITQMKGADADLSFTHYALQKDRHGGGVAQARQPGVAAQPLSKPGLELSAPGASLLISTQHYFEHLNTSAREHSFVGGDATRDRASSDMFMSLEYFIVSLVLVPYLYCSSQSTHNLHKHVCTAPYVNLDFCTNDASQSTFTGFELQLFRQVASAISVNLGQWEAGNWSFFCILDYASLLDAVRDPSDDRFCDVVLAGVLESEINGTGLIMASAEFESGYLLMAYNAPSPSLWTFLQPLDTTMWLFMFLTPVATALALMLLEHFPWSAVLAYCCRSKRAAQRLTATTAHENDRSVGVVATGLNKTLLSDPVIEDVFEDYSNQQKHILAAEKRRINPSQLWNRYSQLQWSSMGLTVRGLFFLTPSTPGGRVVVLSTCFLSLIMVCMYTSAFTAQITISSLRQQITGISDVQDQPVGITQEYLAAQLGLQQPVLLQWQSQNDDKQMLDMLRHGEIAALVIDASFVRYYTAMDCHFVQVGGILLPNDVGFVFPSETSATTIIAFNNALSQLAENGALAQLQEQYLSVPNSCPPYVPGSTTSQQILLSNVGGIWIILASCIGLGSFWNLLSWWVSRTFFSSIDSGMVAAGYSASLQPGGMGRGMSSDGVGGGLMALHHPSRFEGQDPHLRSGYGLQRSPLGTPATLDEAMWLANQKLQEVDRSLSSLPHHFASGMDAKLSELRAGLAVIMTDHLRNSLGRGGT
ncbi:hypothetical protein CEUSTIGMA_g11538.t1 [Chlamydomonas eustigma]|uniref:Ionotropic glutamate receptor C-terminal domain-containing protein n=1 Tax=Chlamydomonas eustigma TaxID=1157962 RepID=A0A250XLY2_9CHLO|nr:hypothetical protein CEUSTIGMA_g11538.t1 [Chlamydomonas eustigma]|eukprot:GAX84115.1 hypothetical protein CEUSTIGMA_g11538.t1 [Chlamydomonas eustigma]